MNHQHQTPWTDLLALQKGCPAFYLDPSLYLPCAGAMGDTEVTGGNDCITAPRFVYQLFTDHDEICSNCLHAIFSYQIC